MGEKFRVLAVDGGGSKTEGWLAEVDADGTRVSRRQRVGSTNLQTVGQTGLAAALDELLERLAPRAEAHTKPTVAVLAMAGSDRPQARRAVAEWARRADPAEAVYLVDDALPVLAAVEQRGAPGALAVIAGTGSLAIGRDAAGNRFRAGGWGPLVGDQGSGVWIAKAGLAAVLAAHDGRGEPTHMTDLVLERLGVATPPELIAPLHQHYSEPARLATLAELVLLASRRGDDVANEVLRRAGKELFGLADAVARRMTLPWGEAPVALGGGVLCHFQPARAALGEAMRSAGARDEAIVLVQQPLEGALQLARGALGLSPERRGWLEPGQRLN